MISDIKTLLKVGGSLLVIVFLIFVANQLIEVYHNLHLIDPILAIGVISFLGMLCLALLVSPLIIYLKMPKALIFPDKPEEWENYHSQLKNRLTKHPTVREMGLNPFDDEDYLMIQEELNKRALEVINESAGAVFLSTAISQNGKLDAFTVLAAQFRQVWKVAHIYWQRPSMRNLWQLYTHVAVNSLAATGIEHLDLSRQIEPIIRAMLKSPARTVPLIGDAAHMITDSILEGSINAFLTLRVGIMTRNYCFPQKHTMENIRNNTFVEASGLLTSLVLRTSGKVIESLVKAGKNISVRTIKTGYSKVGDMVKKGTEGVSSIFKTKEKSDQP